MSKLILVLVGLPFTVFSFWVSITHGPLGFLTLSWREPWAMQMFLDLCISLTVVGAWIRRDARERGLPYLPYLLALPLGSLATLAYLVHRTLRTERSGAQVSDTVTSP